MWHMLCQCGMERVGGCLIHFNMQGLSGRVDAQKSSCSQRCQSVDNRLFVEQIAVEQAGNKLAKI